MAKFVRILRILVISAPIALMLLGSVYPGSSIPEPVTGKVTLMELGSDWCLPCRMMRPVLEGLQKKYPRDLKIMIVDVSKDKEAALKYGVKTIPTQLFFDKEGREVRRHMGYMPEKEITKILEGLGVSR